MVGRIGCAIHRAEGADGHPGRYAWPDSAAQQGARGIEPVDGNVSRQAACPGRAGPSAFLLHCSTSLGTTRELELAQAVVPRCSVPVILHDSQSIPRTDSDSPLMRKRGRPRVLARSL